MKALHLDYIERRSWISVWILAAAILFGLLVLMSRQVITTLGDLQTLDEKSISIQNKIETARGKNNVSVNPQVPSIQLTSRALQLDLNKPFAALENMAIPGVLLVNVSFDMASDGLRVEYSMESISKAAEVTEYLNAGYDTRPWVMESLTSNVEATPVNSLVGNPVVLNSKGVWAVKLTLL